MSLWTEIQAAEATVTNDKQTLATDEAYLASLLTQKVGDLVDVSKYNGNVEWPKVKAAGYSGAICGVADGNIRDELWTPARAKAVREAGLVLGTYYFARVASESNDQRNGREEAGMAVYFARDAGWGHKGDLPLAYDFESLNGQTAGKAATQVWQFITTYKFIEGHYPFIYTNPATWNQVVGLFSAEQLATIVKCPLWVANYGVSVPQELSPWGANWALWQYTSKGAVPGITGEVDLSHYSGNSTEFGALQI